MQTDDPVDDGTIEFQNRANCHRYGAGRVECGHCDVSATSTDGEIDGPATTTAGRRRLECLVSPMWNATCDYNPTGGDIEGYSVNNTGRRVRGVVWLVQSFTFQSLIVQLSTEAGVPLKVDGND